MKKSRRALTLLPALALCAALAVGPRPDVQASDPAPAEFEKSTWPIRNFGAASLGPQEEARLGHWYLKIAENGACSGMNSMVMANYYQRKQDKNAPELNSVARNIGKDKARVLAARAHSYTSYVFPRLRGKQIPTAVVVDKIITALQTTGDPQVIEIWGGGVGHQLTVLNKPPLRQGDDLRLEIYDVNTYVEAVDTRLRAYLHYNAKQDAFYIEWDYGDGRKPKYRDLNTLFHIPAAEMDALIKMLQELIDDAADGTLDGRVGSAGSPGGVALKTAVRPPAGFALKHLGVSREGRVYASDGERSFEVGVDPKVLAVALQGVVLLGQSPWLSIGSETSEAAGKMRVSYGGFIKDTPVGRALLDADLKLKGMSVGAGLGPKGAPAPGVQDFLWTFPRPLAASVLRLWIVGSEVVIDAGDGRLTPRSHGLKLRYELALRGLTTRDEELERFVSRFNERWGEIAAAVPELKRLEEAAFATAVAQWARESGAEVDEALLAYPFAREPTPEYVPALFAAGANGSVGIVGGIDLSGDPPALGLGGMFGIGLAYTLSNAYGHSQAWSALWVSLSLLLALLPVPWVARLSGRSRPSTSRAELWRKAFALWGLVLATLTLTYLATSELLFPLLGDFDAELLSVILVLVAPAYVVRTALARAAGEHSGGLHWAGSAALGLFAFLALSMILVAGQAAMLSAAGGKLTPRPAAACRVLSSPLNLALRPVMSLTLFDHVSDQAASVLRSTFWRFELPGKERRERGEQGEIVLLSLFGLTGPPGTAVTYYELARGGGPFVSREPVYTADPERKPPY